MKTTKHISAGGIVYKPENNQKLWLIIRHVAGHWGFPKGHVGDTIKGEKLEEAAIREVREEGGIDAKVINRQPIPTDYNFRRDDIVIEKVVYYFLMEYVSGDVSDHDEEVTAAEFVPEKELLSRLTYDIDREAFEKLRNL